MGGGGVVTPPALDHQFFFSTNFLTRAKKKQKQPNRSEYSMDAMYLINLMFINLIYPPSGRAPKPKAPAVHGRR